MPQIHRTHTGNLQTNQGNQQKAADTLKKLLEKRL